LLQLLGRSVLNIADFVVNASTDNSDVLIAIIMVVISTPSHNQRNPQWERLIVYES
jgi:hypothetical protein